MRPLLSIVTAAGVAVIVTGQLAACGASVRGAAEQPASPRAVTLSRVSCGSAVTRFRGGRAELQSADPGALPCFAAAVRHCRAARITVTAMGVDTGTHEVFIVTAGPTHCRVIERAQFYSVSGGIRRGPVRTVSCQVVGPTTKAVTLSCGGKTTVFPARAAAAAGQSPGD